MPQYMKIPNWKITLGSTEFENQLGISCDVSRLENGFDTAVVVINDYQSSKYPNVVSAGTSILIDIKDKSDAVYTTIFKGIVRFPILNSSDQGEILKLKCDGSGYGFGDTVCGEEYGSNSLHSSLDTIKEILTDDDAETPPPYGYGIIPKWVNKILGSDTDSGFAYTTTYVDTITGTLPYIFFPYKPNNKVLADLCDLVTAVKAGNAGPHWIVDVNDNLRVKLIDGTQTGWTKYYGNSEANATLEQGIDFKSFQIEHMGPEANLILYYGIVQKPGSGDLCEANASSWASNIIGLTGDCTITNDINVSSDLSSDAASGQKIVNVVDGSGFEVNDFVYLSSDVAGKEENIIDSINANELTMVNNLSTAYNTADNAEVIENNVRLGTYSIKSYVDDVGTSVNAYYPSTKNLSINVDAMGSPNNIPTIDFHIRIDENCTLASLQLSLWHWIDATHHGYFYRNINTLVTVDKWAHITLPIGTYYKRSPIYDGVEWQNGFLGYNLGDWSDIDLVHIDVSSNGGTRGRIWIDGLRFNGRVIRIAKNSTNITDNKLKTKIIIDNIGKDDSLQANDDTGFMAQMAYAELLRNQKTSLAGFIIVPMIKDLLPGQWLHIHAKKTSSGDFNIDTDMRVVKITHHIGDNYSSIIELTDDRTNSRARPRYEDINKVLASARPEWQDRQAASIKAGEIDLLLTKLEKDYPS